MRRVVVLLLLASLSLPWLAGKKNHRRHIAVSACADTDDFSTDTFGTCWTKIKGGTWTISGGTLNGAVTSPDASNFVIHEGARAADQYQAWTIDLDDTLWSYVFRHNGSGTAYGIRMNTSQLRWVKTTNYCDSYTTIETCDTGECSTVSDGDNIGVAVEDTGSSTTVSIWNCEGTSMPADYADWTSTCGGPTTLSDPGSNNVDGAGKVGVCSVGAMDGTNLDNFQAGDV